MTTGMDRLNQAIMENEETAWKGMRAGKRMVCESGRRDSGKATVWGDFAPGKDGTEVMYRVHVKWEPNTQNIFNKGTRHERPYHRTYKTYRGWLTCVRRNLPFFGTEPWTEEVR